MNLWFRYLYPRSLAKQKESLLQTQSFGFGTAFPYFLISIKRLWSFFLKAEHKIASSSNRSWGGLSGWSHTLNSSSAQAALTTISFSFFTPTFPGLAITFVQLVLTQLTARSVPQPSSLHSNRQSCQQKCKQDDWKEAKAREPLKNKIQSNHSQSTRN